MGYLDELKDAFIEGLLSMHHLLETAFLHNCTSPCS